MCQQTEHIAHYSCRLIKIPAATPTLMLSGSAVETPAWPVTGCITTAPNCPESPFCDAPCRHLLLLLLVLKQLMS
jgi:hypothetical protein